MSVTEPLTHVKVRGRHLFIPRSLTDTTYRRTGCASMHDDDDEVLCEVFDGNCDFSRDGFPRGRSEADMPTAEERRVLHELLTAVVLSASCRCRGIDGMLTGSGDLSDDSNGVTNFSRTTLSTAPTIAPVTGTKGLEEQHHIHSCGGAPLTFKTRAMETEKPNHATGPSGSCSNAQTVACAVAVILFSCALLRTTCD